MRKFLLIVLCLVMAILLLWFGGGALLNQNYAVERSILIDASTRDIHKYVEDLERWPDWQPWTREDKSITVTLGKDTDGVGASQTWTGAQGDGEIVITKSERKTGIDFDMTMMQRGKKPLTSKCQVRYEEAENDRIKVTWAMQGRMDTAGGGWLAMLMPRTIGRSFDAGLANLKKLAEAE